MNRKLEIESLLADLAALDSVLANTPANDFAGRIGLESRRQELESRIRELHDSPGENLANVALFLGGHPVIGSRGIQAEFAGEVVTNYQDLVSKIWAAEGSGQLASTGPIKSVEASQLHITELIHGSLGFLLEELDEFGTPLFPSPLKDATSKATQLILAFASEHEDQFEAAIEAVPARVFNSLRDFLKTIRREEAVFRLVEGEVDAAFDEASVERAYARAEAYSIDEEVFDTEGELLGVIPIGRRFEFKQSDGAILRGNVGLLFSQSYLERIESEQFVGKRWKARLNRRRKKSFGKAIETLTLLDLHELASK